LHTSRVVYLISYFAAGDSLRSNTPERHFLSENALPWNVWII